MTAELPVTDKLLDEKNHERVEAKVGLPGVPPYFPSENNFGHLDIKCAINGDNLGLEEDYDSWDKGDDDKKK